MTLPQELLDNILDNLCDDLESLKHCALAYSLLRATSQRIQFRRVVLGPAPSGRPTPCFRFFVLLTESPHISLHVKSLVIMDRKPFSWHTWPKTIPWIVTEQTLPLLLAKLTPNLTAFHMHTRSPWGRIAETRALHAALLHVLASPKLSYLQFKDVSPPASSILLAPGLRGLLLSNAELLEDCRSHTPAGASRAIHRIGLMGKHLDWITSPQCPLDWRLLRKLRVSSDHTKPHTKALQLVLDRCAQSLTEFEFFPAHPLSLPRPLPSLSLSKSAVLRRLCVYLVCGQEQDKTVVDWFVPLLDSLDPAAPIMLVTIHFEAWDYAGTMGDRYDWTAFDECLTRVVERRWARVLFRCAGSGTYPTAGEFPQLWTTGRLHIEKSSEELDELQYAAF
ncbi:unnamed protein product [Mycena citricolor]|uniref:Uncharacterized protein n=1 Tax=Mycena citricolor TaxID=2018698 RepID=A0AAD2JZG8_9AGAR|nr:unnamed protein product [Mycena citricolor]